MASTTTIHPAERREEEKPLSAIVDDDDDDSNKGAGRSSSNSNNNNNNNEEEDNHNNKLVFLGGGGKENKNEMQKKDDANKEDKVKKVSLSEKVSSGPEEEEDDDSGDEKDAEDDMDDKDNQDSKHSVSEADDDSSSDSDASSSSDEEEEGGLSQYEKLRLARIRRNQEKMAELGLETAVQSTIHKKPSHKRQKPAVTPVPSRSSLSRRTKQIALNYATLQPLQQQTNDDDNTSNNNEDTSTQRVPKTPLEKSTSLGTMNDDNSNNRQDTTEKKSKRNRLDLNIYQELLRIRNTKKNVLRDAKKAHAQALREVRYWKRVHESHSKKMERLYQQQVRENRLLEERAAQEEEIRALGGYTTRGLLMEIDRRMPELQGAANKYDASIQKEKDLLDMEQNRLILQTQAQMVRDTEIEFPKAMQDATLLLNTVLQERAPKDPPPPRRSRRSGPDSTELTPKRKKAKKAEIHRQEDSPKAVAPLLPPLLLPSSSLMGAEDDKEGDDGGSTNTAAKTSQKKKKPKAKNIGGWISPDFAQRVDRLWLLEPAMSPADYVPQVGDVMLYYPAGHKAFLEEYPDVLGKKLRSLTRIPLWERAKNNESNGCERKKKPRGRPESIKSKKEATSQQEDCDDMLGVGGMKQRTKSSKQSNEPDMSSHQEECLDGQVHSPLEWWTKEWLDGMLRKDNFDDDDDDDDHCQGPHLRPILCVVQSTHPEFPPESCKPKVSKKGDGAEEIVFRGDGSPGRKNKHYMFQPKLRLAVMLRPIAPITNCNEGAEHNQNNSQQNLPPTFAVVTFPTSTHRPFLIPFAWAYSTSHKLQVGEHVKLAPAVRTHGRPAQGIMSSYDATVSGLLSDKVELISTLLNDKTLLGSIRSTALSGCEKIRCLTPMDISAILDTFETFLSSSNTLTDYDEETKRANPGREEGRMHKRINDPISFFWNLICSTLPVWDAVSVRPEFSGMGKKEQEEFRFSPWELAPLSSKQRGGNHNSPVMFSGCLDDSLTMKIRASLEQLIQDHPSAPDFIDEVSEDDAPQYSCAVPVPMYFRRIILRLGGGGSAKNQKNAKCYYRSMGGLLSDVAMIRDNCLLYNNPESEVVDSAIDIVSAAKDIIARDVKAYNKEVSEIRKADEERQRLVMLHCGGTSLTEQQREDHGAEEGNMSKQPVVCRTRNPFKQEIHHEWLQLVRHSNGNEGGSCQTSAEKVTSWVPQAGDRIQYSRKRHAQFVMNHYQSLETAQCNVAFSHKNTVSLTVMSQTGDAGVAKQVSQATSTCSGDKTVASRSQEQIDTSKVPQISGPNGGGRDSTMSDGFRAEPNHFDQCITQDVTKDCPMSVAPIVEVKPGYPTEFADGSQKLGSCDKGGADARSVVTDEVGERPCGGDSPETWKFVEVKSSVNDGPSETARDSWERATGDEGASAMSGAVSIEKSLQIDKTSPVDVVCRTSDADDDWEGALVMWTRACFPKVFSKKSREDALTFATNSTLLAVGVLFEYCGRTETIYWRPCLFAFDEEAGCGGSCRSCGLSAKESFLRAIPTTSIQINSLPGMASISPPTQHGSSTQNGSFLLDDEAQAIYGCLTFLKRQCVRGVLPSALESNCLTDAPTDDSAPLRTEMKLPSYEHLLFKNPAVSQKSENQGHNQGTVIEEQLLSRGYVPPWFESVDEETEDETCPRWYETVSPWSRLSMELVELRLKNGYYRHREAIYNDLVEAYASTCFLLLGRAAGRKKLPLSIKRVARFADLPKHKGKKPSNTEDRPTSEEDMFVSRVSEIRELYATALVCVSSTKTASRIFGLTSYAVTNSGLVQLKEDPTRSAGRKKLEYLLNALDIEPSPDYFLAGPPDISRKSLKIVCGGETVSIDRHYQKLGEIQPHDACNPDFPAALLGEPEVFDLADAPLLENPLANLDGFDVRVRVICDGEDVQIPDLPSNVLVTRKQDRIRFNIDDFETNDILTRMYLCRPGMMNSCARCQAARNSIFSCRFQKCHSTVDFDWISFFGDIGSLDNLLLQIDPTHPVKPFVLRCDLSRGEPTVARKDEIAPTNSHGGNTDSGGQKESRKAAKNGTEAPADEKDEDTEHVDPADMNLDKNGNTELLDPSKIFFKARSVAAEAGEILADAEKYAAAADLMSSEFIESTFPVDHTDGRYIYCIICGLSGDLLCCEGCANVVHADCVNLEKVPDGEWFCEECQINGVGVAQCAKKDVAKNDSVPHQSIAPSQGQEQKKMPFGRFDFDPQRLRNIFKLLRDLQKANPDRIITDPCATRVRKEKKQPTDPFDVLTTSTKEFLQTVGIDSADELVVTRTSKIGPKFAEWRKAKGMIELKSDGAMASCRKWKRMCREAACKIGYVFPHEAGDTSVQKEGTEGGASVRKEPTEGGASIQKEGTECDEAVRKEGTRCDALGRKEGAKCDEAVRKETGECDEAVRKETGECENEVEKKKPRGRPRKRQRRSSVCQETGDPMAALSDDVDRKEASECENEEKKKKPRGRPRKIQRRSSVCQETGDPMAALSDDADRKEASEGENKEEKKQVLGRPKKKQRRSSVCQDTGDPMDALSENAKEFFASIGIDSVDTFLASKTSDVADLLVKWREEKNLPKLKATGQVATISAWKTACRTAVNMLRHESPKTKKDTSKQKPVEPVVTPRSSRAQKRSQATPSSVPSPRSAPALKTAPNTPTSFPSPRSAPASKTAPKTPATTAKKSDPNKEIWKALKGGEPLDVLSNPAREFLRSINVMSAQQFLCLRNSDVAEELARWRREQGLPRLQGNGNGATISAWRTLCKNAREALRIGSESQGVKEEGETSGIISTSFEEGWTPPRKRRKIEFHIPEDEEQLTSHVLDVEEPAADSPPFKQSRHGK